MIGILIAIVVLAVIGGWMYLEIDSAPVLDKDIDWKKEVMERDVWGDYRPEELKKVETE